MRRGDWGWGLTIGLLFAVLGLGLRSLGIGYPVLGLYAQITYWLGIPAVFNLIHKLFGYGNLAKEFAFASTVVLWLLLHPFFFWGLRKRPWLWGGLLFLFYGYLGGWWTAVIGEGGDWVKGIVSGFVYTLLALGSSHLRSMRVSSNPSRREGLKGLGILGLGLLLTKVRAQPKAPSGVPWSKIPGLSPRITPQQDLYYVSKNLPFFDPDLVGKPYELQVSGLIEHPHSLDLAALKALPKAELVDTLTCISNPVGGPLIGCPRWLGVPLHILFEKAKPRPEATWAIWQAADGYIESIEIDQIPPQAMLAYAIEDPKTGAWQDLEVAHGYPTRLLIPGRYGMKQPKWLTQIRLSDQGELGYWAQRGWSKTAIIRTMSRIDTPSSGSLLKAGVPIYVAGIAFAGGRPLEAVQLSFDGGKTWKPTVLRPPLGKYAWQQWAYRWVPTPGNYTLTVRAVEVGGRIQDPHPSPALPDGATGYDRVGVRVV
jgi:DMSO/TMAO reductase YedYZ molybdopterin-dependent catalytic subunit